MMSAGVPNEATTISQIQKLSSEMLMKKNISFNMIYDTACQLITLLNAYIYKRGKSPIRYKSKHFEKIVKDCMGDCGPIIDIKPALKELDLKLEPYRYRKLKNRCCGAKRKITDFHTAKDLENFRKWIIRKLNQGKLIDFGMWHPRWNGHSVLIAEHYKINKSYYQRQGQWDMFKIINAQLFTKNNPIEYVTWEQLTSELWKSKRRDKLNGLSNSTFSNTKAIVI